MWMRRLNPESDEKGAALVELALLSVVLLVLAFGTVDVGRAIFNRIAVEDAAQSAISWASLEPSVTTQSMVSKAEQSLTSSGMDPALATIGTPCRAATGRNVVSMTITYPISLITPVVSGLTGPINIAASAQGEVFRDTAFASGLSACP